jgi:hypothetical protein
MKMTMKVRVLTLVATIALLGGTAFVASGSTGAYFSDSVTGGGVSGTVGSIHISGTSPTSISFSDLLPGVAQSTQPVSYMNSGANTEDVYLTFPNLTALSALNDLGRFGSVTITDAANTVVFQSFNLNDNTSPTHCATFSNAIPTGPNSGCWPLPSPVLIASSLPPGQSDSFTFTFEYASVLAGQPVLTAPWNSFPVSGQFTVVPSDLSGAGLPFTIVATQVGITPGQVGSKF